MKITIISMLATVVLIGGAFMLISGQGTNNTATQAVNNVSIVDGKQIITVSAKGGYTPRKSTAKAGIPTVLQLSTNGTFDCSSIVNIPSLNLSKNLPPSGVTEINLG